MSPPPKHRNPFYVLLVIVGTAFAVTAVAYGVMAVVLMRHPAPVSGQSADHPLLTWLRVHGEATMLSELALLALFTVAAMVTDSWWTRRSSQGSAGPRDHTS